MKRIITIIAIALCASVSSLQASAVAVAVPQSKTAKASKASKAETVTFCTNLRCKNCVKKINENIAFEKGVKDLKVSLPDQTITVTYDPSKTSADALSKAISKLGYKAEVKK